MKNLGQCVKVSHREINDDDDDDDDGDGDGDDGDDDDHGDDGVVVVVVVSHLPPRYVLKILVYLH